MENHEDKERLAFENELKKAKLIAETGAKFGGLSNLPPEIESQWLDQIHAFDHAFNNAKRIKLKQSIGNPVLKLPSELSDEEISHELDKVVELLHKNNIVLDTICEVEEREVYRFIVEELMEEEVDDVKAEGWTSHFIYEEFHPNHEYDIQRAVKDYLLTLLGGDISFCDATLAHEIISVSGETLKVEAVKSILECFIEANAGATLEELVFKENSIDEEGAFQKFYIRYKTKLQESDEAIVLDGDGTFTFTYMYGYYYINGISIPGFTL